MINTFFGEAQAILDRLRWGWPDADDSDALQGRVAVVGLAGAGKKTLLNSLWGWQALEGTPVDESVRDFGLFRLVDLPADPLAADAVLFRLEGMDLIIYVLDATAGLRAEDFPWIARLRALGTGLVVALNKIDLVSADALPGLLAELEGRLSMPVVPLRAAPGTDRQRRGFASRRTIWPGGFPTR